MEAELVIESIVCTSLLVPSTTGGDSGSRISSQFVDQVRQRLAADELHGIEVNATFFTDRVHRDDIRMIQRRGRSHFVVESLQ